MVTDADVCPVSELLSDRSDGYVGGDPEMAIHQGGATSLGIMWKQLDVGRDNICLPEGG